MPEKKIQDDKIREIPAKAYAENRELTGIVIPEGVEIIGEKAFYFCTGLKTVTFPKSLREIRVEAFSNCRSLKEIVIPDGYPSWNRRHFPGVRGWSVSAFRKVWPGWKSGYF